MYQKQVFMKFIFSILFGGMLFFTAPEAHAQLFKTKLQVTVRNDLGNIVEGAEVSIFKTEADYDKEVNAVATGKTDEKGRVLFKDLEPVAYFMHVEKGDNTNMGRGVKTAKLISKKKNKVNVVIQ